LSIAKDGFDGADPRAYVSPRNKQAFHVVADQLGGPSNVGRNDRGLERHRFEHGIRTSFPIRRLDEDIEGVVEGNHIGPLAKQATTGLELTTLNEILQRFTPTAFAYNHQ
jgi:hypothetical protein